MANRQEKKQTLLQRVKRLETVVSQMYLNQKMLMQVFETDEEVTNN